MLTIDGATSGAKYNVKRFGPKDNQRLTKTWGIFEQYQSLLEVFHIFVQSSYQAFHFEPLGYQTNSKEKKIGVALNLFAFHQANS